MQTLWLSNCVSVDVFVLQLIVRPIQFVVPSRRMEEEDAMDTDAETTEHPGTYELCMGRKDWRTIS